MIEYYKTHDGESSLSVAFHKFDVPISVRVAKAYAGVRDTDDYKAFVEKNIRVSTVPEIKRLLAETDLSFSQIAKKVGCTVSHIAHIQQEHRIRKGGMYSVKSGK